MFELRTEAYRVWTCPKCQTRNKTPIGPHTLVITKEWDFCKNCGEPRKR
jgi:hypothetical protein